MIPAVLLAVTISLTHLTPHEMEMAISVEVPRQEQPPAGDWLVHARLDLPGLTETCYRLRRIHLEGDEPVLLTFRGTVHFGEIEEKTVTWALGGTDRPGSLTLRWNPPREETRKEVAVRVYPGDLAFSSLRSDSLWGDVILDSILPRIEPTLPLFPADRD